MNKIAQLPRIFREPTRQISTQGMARPWLGVKEQRHFGFDAYGRTLEFSGLDLGRYQITWLTTSVTPCTIAAAAQFEADNTVAKAIVGHFSANDAHLKIPEMLQGYEPASSIFFMAGMSGRSSPETLSRSCRNLSQNLTELGWPVILGWSMKDRPEFALMKGDSFTIISDLGRGLYGAGREPAPIMRRVLIGLTSEHLAFYSLTYENEITPTSVPVTSELFLSGLGKVEI